MSPFHPQVKANDLIRVAKRLGFDLDRQKGSHAVFYRVADKARIVIPIHANRDIKAKTLHGIIADMGITPDEFKNSIAESHAPCDRMTLSLSHERATAATVGSGDGSNEEPAPGLNGGWAARSAAQPE